MTNLTVWCSCGGYLLKGVYHRSCWKRKGSDPLTYIFAPQAFIPTGGASPFRRTSIGKLTSGSWRISCPHPQPADKSTSDRAGRLQRSALYLPVTESTPLIYSCHSQFISTPFPSTRHVVPVGGFVGAGSVYLPKALGSTNNGYLPPKCPIHPRNPPDLTREDPRHPRSILYQKSDSHFSPQKPIYIIGDAGLKTHDAEDSSSSAIQCLESCVLCLVSCV